MKTRVIILVVMVLTAVLTLSSCEQINPILHQHKWVNATCETPKTCSECNATEGEALGHDMVIDAAVAADCVNTGLTEGSHCTRCDHNVAQEIAPALGHTEGQAVKENEIHPSCSETGSHDDVVYCSVCNVELERNTVVDPATGAHNYANEAARVEATCEEAGYYVMACDCGAEDKPVEIPALDHDMVIDAAVAADCVNTGLTEGSHCTRCDHNVAQDIVPALGHTEGQAVKENEIHPSCSETGSHDDVVYCSVCNVELERNTVVDPATGAHNYANEAARVEATCEEAGYYIMACGCGAEDKPVEIPALDHDMVIDAAVAADCVNTGLTEGSHCTRCDHNVAQDIVPALGHTEGDAVIENKVDASCTAEGSYDSVTYCSVCTVELSRASETIEKLPHTEVFSEAEAATCINTGLSAGSHCSVCNKVLISQEITPTVDHNYADGDKCVVCNKNKNDDTLGKFELGADSEETGHKDGQKIENGVYTDTIDDITLDLSSVSNSYANEFDAKGNCGFRIGSKSSVGKFTINLPENVTRVIIYAAQYKNNASTLKITVGGEAKEYSLTRMSNDGRYEAIVIDITGGGEIKVETVSGSSRVMITSIELIGVKACTHEYDEGVETTPATCLDKGEKTFTCGKCGNTKVEEIPALGHSFVGGNCGNCGKPEFDAPSTPVVKDTIEFGANGSANHKDGTKITSDTVFEGSNGYSITITPHGNTYSGAFDAKGNSCLKIGSSSATGSFSFTVSSDVTKVVIYVAQYKANDTNVSWSVGEVNGALSITTASNDGEYTAIEIDTSVNKKITFRSESGGVRCMINAIELHG